LRASYTAVVVLTGSAFLLVGCSQRWDGSILGCARELYGGPHTRSGTQWRWNACHIGLVRGDDHFPRRSRL